MRTAAAGAAAPASTRSRSSALASVIARSKIWRIVPNANPRSSSPPRASRTRIPESAARSASAASSALLPQPARASTTTRRPCPARASASASPSVASSSSRSRRAPERALDLQRSGGSPDAPPPLALAGWDLRGCASGAAIDAHQNMTYVLPQAGGRIQAMRRLGAILLGAACTLLVVAAPAFGAAGGWVGAWGKDVVAGNAETGAEVCTVAALCQAGQYGNGPGEFSTPRDVAVAPNGDVYVADEGAQHIEVFEAGGTFIRTLGGFSSPNSVAIDG